MSDDRGTPFAEVRPESRLHAAWERVRRNGLRPSSSKRSREMVLDFERRSRTHIKRISDQIRSERFKFEPVEGIPVGKDSGRSQSQRRPIVVAPIENRIVQRALLDVLNDQPGIQAYHQTPTSFGAVRRRGVPEAIRAACRAIKGGARFYLRSDIGSFFMKVDRMRTLRAIEDAVGDERFARLLGKATETELANLGALKASGFAHLFPTHELGVAQGCALSPLFGNVLLHAFDAELNASPDVVCLRYVDDVLLLGSCQREVMAAFTRGQDHLAKLGDLRLYTPGDASGKADCGSVARGLEFLGCVLGPGFIRPSRSAKRRLLIKVEELLDESFGVMAHPLMVGRRRAGLAQTLVAVDYLVRGWGDQYKFCTDASGMEGLDRQIDRLLDRFWRGYLRRRELKDSKVRADDERRLLGVGLLQDCKREPIVWADI